ncbi:urotensin II-related peptide [Esox lucius]|uniref:Urotensin II-related peptide n=1 Tax=Esox lucius TaxID=8010 RepID=A0A3P8ZG67_ESOLU|nr:urotensin II-related peptide [Esox lucius]
MQKGSVVLVGVLTVLITMWAGVDPAPTLLTDRGDTKPSDPATDDSAERPRTQASSTSTSKALKKLLMTTRPASGEKTPASISNLNGQLKMDEGTSSPGRRAQILNMLSALEELSRKMNNSLSTRMTVMTRGSPNGRNPAKKNKAVAAEDAVKVTTVPPVDVRGNVTASRTSTDHIDPSSRKKSLQPKKPSNKRVCFWKYCSQN